MKGSVKQVAWAESILADAKKVLVQAQERAERIGNFSEIEAAKEGTRQMNMLIAHYEELDDAKVIIDNRRKLDATFIYRLIEEIRDIGVKF